MSDIRFFDRKSATYQTEKVYGDSALKWAYGSTLGRGIVSLAANNGIVSKIYGAMQSSPFSKS